MSVLMDRTVVRIISVTFGRQQPTQGRGAKRAIPPTEPLFWVEGEGGEEVVDKRVPPTRTSNMASQGLVVVSCVNSSPVIIRAYTVYQSIYLSIRQAADLSNVP